MFGILKICSFQAFLSIDFFYWAIKFAYLLQLCGISVELIGYFGELMGNLFETFIHAGQINTFPLCVFMIKIPIDPSGPFLLWALSLPVVLNVIPRIKHMPGGKIGKAWIIIHKFMWSFYILKRPIIP